MDVGDDCNSLPPTLQHHDASACYLPYHTHIIITITRGILQRGRSAAGGHPRSLPGLSASVITATAVSASPTHSQRSLCHLSDTGGVPRQERLWVGL